MRLERLFKVLVLGGMALGAGAAACSDDGGAAGQVKQSASGGASGAGSSASGGTPGSGGAVASGGGSAGSAGSAGSSPEDSGPDVLVAEDGGTDDASDAQTDGVDSWLSWFS